MFAGKLGFEGGELPVVSFDTFGWSFVAAFQVSVFSLSNFSIFQR